MSSVVATAIRTTSANTQNGEAWCTSVWMTVGGTLTVAEPPVSISGCT
jgi:hypothetical protein